MNEYKNCVQGSVVTNIMLKTVSTWIGGTQYTVKR